jgi:hypothetical protein
MKFLGNLDQILKRLAAGINDDPMQAKQTVEKVTVAPKWALRNLEEFNENVRGLGTQIL